MRHLVVALASLGVLAGAAHLVDAMSVHRASPRDVWVLLDPTSPAALRDLLDRSDARLAGVWLHGLVVQVRLDPAAGAGRLRRGALLQVPAGWLAPALPGCSG